jgi:hypothetical protein
VVAGIATLFRATASNPRDAAGVPNGNPGDAAGVPNGGLITHDPIICEKSGSTTVNGGKYIVQNNVWGADTEQCIEPRDSGGFTVTRSGHNSDPKGRPAAYPSVYVGCHYGKCSDESKLPLRVDSREFTGLETSVRMSYAPDGSWNATYDLWFDPGPRTDGQNEGAEIMIWLEQRGGVRPIGSRVGAVTLDGRQWNVWFGNDGWNVVSYVAVSPLTALELKVDTFYTDAVARGYAQREWYLTSVQAGFESWIGGSGLAVDAFSYTAPQ